MAKASPPPDTADDAVDAPVPDPQPDVCDRRSPTPSMSRWVYTGPPGRIYTHVPVTVDPGDVIAWPELPAGDGAWESTDAEVTRLPDNHRPEPDDAITEEG